MNKEIAWNHLKWIKNNQKESRIFLGTKAIITETKYGVYDIKYSQVWEKSGNEQFAEILAYAIMSKSRLNNWG
jgi:hypothetical protein